MDDGHVSMVFLGEKLAFFDHHLLAATKIVWQDENYSH